LLEFAEMEKWCRYRGESKDRVFAIAVGAVLAMAAVPVFATTSSGKEIAWANMGVSAAA